MNNIDITKDESSPEVLFDYSNGIIELEGKSYPENTFDFYEPLLAWLSEYFSGKCQESTVVNLKLTYFNSATTQTLFDILDIINEGEYKTLTVNWFYDSENENALEDYEDFSAEFEDLNIQAVAYAI